MPAAAETLPHESLSHFDTRRDRYFALGVRDPSLFVGHRLQARSDPAQSEC